MVAALTDAERKAKGMAPLSGKDKAALTRRCPYCHVLAYEDCISHKSKRAEEAKERTAKPHYERTSWR